LAGNDKWRDYVRNADEFFIAYAMTCPCALLSNHLFLIGHAVELYLKAVYIKQTNDEINAIKKGHKLKGLYKSCQENVPPFLLKFKFKENHEIFNFRGNYKELLELEMGAIKSGKSLTDFEREKVLHFISYKEFYLISENLNNLKYIYCQWKHSRDPFWREHLQAIASIKPNPFWIEFVKQVRSFLGYGGEDNDMIKLCLEGFACPVGELPNMSRSYLSEIFDDNSNYQFDR